MSLAMFIFLTLFLSFMFNLVMYVKDTKFGMQVILNGSMDNESLVITKVAVLFGIVSGITLMFVIKVLGHITMVLGV